MIMWTMVSSISCGATKSGVPPTGKRGASSLTERTDIKVLVACEESQAVCIAFRRLGYEAYSCDIQECSGGHPEWHIKVDALLLLGRYLVFKTEDGKAHYVERWDLIIAHPPCTFMSNAGACRMYPRKGQIDKARFQKAMEAKAFFLRFLNADCDRVAIENPRPLKIVELPKEDQRIQPYQFGDPWSKLTYLWLKNLPPIGLHQCSCRMEALCSCRNRSQGGGGTAMEQKYPTIPKPVQKHSPVLRTLWRNNGAQY